MTKGLVRLDPEPDRPALPPSVWIRGLRIAGVPWPVADVGQAAVTGIQVASNQNQVQIDFVGLYFTPGEALRYEYQLEGARPDWQATDQRTVRFDHLAPGAYQFRVRAVSTDGLVSPSPATVAFTIRPPLWRRRWFLATAGLLVAGLLYALYRYRVARLLELERVRTRIATDLHDDIGSSLSHMAILSEVARRRIGRDDRSAKDLLAEIAEASRQVIDTMSDIVWAIDPTKDRLRDLTQRMRHFASDFLPGHGVDFTWHADGAPPDLPLGADRRREIFLVFKESLHNLVRHAAATRAVIEFRVEGERLILRVEDNGGGFDPAVVEEGHGLQSMRQRAGGLGGQFDIRSQPGQGTTVRLSVPLQDHR